MQDNLDSFMNGKINSTIQQTIDTKMSLLEEKLKKDKKDNKENEKLKAKVEKLKKKKLQAKNQNKKFKKEIKDLKAKLAEKDKEISKKEEKPLESQPQEPKPVHHNIICDICDKTIVGTRFKCLQTHDYDLCENCEKTHHKEYLMLRITDPKVLSNHPVDQHGNATLESNIHFSNLGENHVRQVPQVKTMPCQVIRNEATKHVGKFVKMTKDLFQGREDIKDKAKKWFEGVTEEMGIQKKVEKKEEKKVEKKTMADIQKEQLEKLKQDLSEETQPFIEEKPKKSEIDLILEKIEKYQKNNDKAKLKKFAMKIISDGKKMGELLKGSLDDKKKMKELTDKIGVILSELKKEKSQKIEEKPTLQESPKEEVPETTITEEVQEKQMPLEGGLTQEMFAKYIQLTNVCILADNNKLKVLVKNNPQLNVDELVNLAFEM